MTSNLTAYDMFTLALFAYFELTMLAAFAWTVAAHKNGGVWFARLGRVGGSFYVARRRVYYSAEGRADV